MQDLLEISLPRGDLHAIEFYITDSDGNVPDVEISEIYFTVKRHYYDKQYVFQKRFSTEDIEPLGPGQYQFVIQPKDTEHLSFGDYDFDLEFVGPELKKTCTGQLHLTQEVTHAANEGD